MSFNNKDRLITPDDIKQFEFHFEAILDNEASFKCFTSFLHQSLNDESVEFLEAVNEYRKIKFDKKREQVAKQLVETFILDDSPKQLNLKAPVRNKILISTASLFEKQSPRGNNGTPSTPKEEDTFTGSRNSPRSYTSVDDCVLSSSNYSPRSDYIQQSPREDFCSVSSSFTSSTSILSYAPKSSVTKTLFDEAEASILVSLKECCFRSFIESPTFTTFVYNQPLKLLFEIGTLKTGNLLFMESLGDLKTEYFTKHEIKFIKDKLTKTTEDEWELVSKTKNHKTWMSTHKYDFGGTVGVHFIKFEVIFPNNVHQVMNTLNEVEYRYLYDGNLFDIKSVKYISKEGSGDDDNPILATSITHEAYKLSWPFSDRDFIMANAAVYDKTDDLYIIAKKSCECDTSPPLKKGAIRCKTLGGWIFQKIDDNTTRHLQLFYCDMGGKVPRRFVSNLMKFRCKNFYQVGLKYLKLNEKRGFVCQNDARILETLKENGSCYL
ncbi:hypothetical protein ABK040_003130 [Willaertia magna]